MKSSSQSVLHLRPKATPKAMAQAYAQTRSEDDIEKLVDDFLPLVRSLVGRMSIYFPHDYEREELYSIALTALIQAANNFDATQAKTFGAYAKIRVRGALLDELRRMDWLSRNERSQVKAFRAKVEALEHKYNRPLSETEIIKKLKLTPADYHYLKQLREPREYIPLDATFGDPSLEGPSLHDLLGDPTQPNSRDLAENKEAVSLVKEALLELDEQSQKVLSFYHLEGLLLEQIARIMGVTESRVSQIHSQALKRLRACLLKKMQK